MNLQRLLHTPLADLADRGRQELWKSVERIGTPTPPDGQSRLHLVGESRPPAAGNRARPARASRAVFERFLSRGAANFFAGFNWAKVPALFAGQWPDDRDRIVALADAACEERLDLLGYQGLHIGRPVDWHRDPVSGRRAPLVHWSRVHALDAANLGDSKLTWELNRHQWFLYLGQAYRFTQEERYAESWAAYLKSWLADNPPELGINWASSLEQAYRLIAWCWSLHLFWDSRALTAELFADVVESIRRQAAHVERYLSRHYSPNTHLTGEALGLLYAGLVFPDLGAAPRWRQLGQRILLRQLRRQVLADGVYFEQATCYQHYTVETYLHWLMLAARNGLTVPASVGESVQRMLDFLLTLRRPDGSMPQIGDADGGRLLPLVRRAPEDFRGVFAAAAAWFRRPDYAWAAGGMAPEVLWLLGEAGQIAFERLTPTTPHRTSRVFRHGGYAVMRDTWEPHGHQLIFDVGPLGCPVSGGHGHADLLSIQCSTFGETHLPDPGTYCYTADAQWRDYFRGTSAHSTVTVDECNQALPAGAFSWRRRPQARLNRWQSTAEFDLADAEHDAYSNLPDPVVHRRRVFFAKPRYWLVVDDLLGLGLHEIQLRYQFALTTVVLDADGWVHSCAVSGAGLLLRAFAAVPLRADLQHGNTQPHQGWLSSDYGSLQAAPMLRYRSAAQLPLRIVTLLLPAADAMAAPPAVSAQFVDGELRLLFQDSGEAVCVNGHSIIPERRSASAPGARKD